MTDRGPIKSDRMPRRHGNVLTPREWSRIVRIDSAHVSCSAIVPQRGIHVHPDDPFGARSSPPSSPASASPCRDTLSHSFPNSKLHPHIPLISSLTALKSLRRWGLPGTPATVGPFHCRAAAFAAIDPIADPNQTHGTMEAFSIPRVILPACKLSRD